MRIGEVHALLRQDFPDIELSKIRYYEDKGLVKPLRSKKGYRLYSDRDVACLREAIRLANEEFVPLRVVRLRLIEAGLLADDGASMAPAPRAAARSAAAPTVSLNVPTPVKPATVTPIITAPAAAPTLLTKSTYSLSELLETSGLSSTQVQQLLGVGLLHQSTTGGSETFGASDVEIATFAAPLLARGVDVRVLGGLRRIAEREIGLIEDVLATMVATSANDDGRTYDVAQEVTQLRGALSSRALRDYLGN